MIYVDTCALVKLVIDEKESAALAAALVDRRSEMASSDIAVTEVVRSVKRSGFDDQRRPRVDPVVLNERLDAAGRLLDELDFVPLDRITLLAAAAYDADPILGSLDAIHLVSALEIGPELAAFVTYDKKLARAAEEAGLPLLQPA